MQQHSGALMNILSISSESIVKLNLFILLAQLNVSVQHMCAASLAEITQALVRNPSEVIKQNLQVGHYTGMLDCAADIFKH